MNLKGLSMKKKLLLSAALFLMLGLIGFSFRAWYEQPERKVPRLLNEIDAYSEFDFFNRSRPYEEIHADFQRMGPRAVPPLIEALQQHPRFRIRRIAANKLGDIGDARAVEPLIHSLRYDEEYVRYAVADALGRIGDRRAVQPLIFTLQNDTDSVVRAWAADALGKLKARQAVLALCEALKHKDINTRFLAALALGEIGDAQAVTPLIALLKDEHHHPQVYAIEALEQIGDKRAIAALALTMLNAKADSWIRGRAAKALLKLLGLS
jgi:HEAT repeat protein